MFNPAPTTWHLQLGDARGAVPAPQHLHALTGRASDIRSLHDRDRLAPIQVDRNLQRVLARRALLDDLAGRRARDRADGGREVPASPAAHRAPELVADIAATGGAKHALVALDL